MRKIYWKKKYEKFIEYSTAIILPLGVASMYENEHNESNIFSDIFFILAVIYFLLNFIFALNTGHLYVKIFHFDKSVDKLSYYFSMTLYTLLVLFFLLVAFMYFSERLKHFI